jgi:hypothetical protein
MLSMSHYQVDAVANFRVQMLLQVVAMSPASSALLVAAVGPAAQVRYRPMGMQWSDRQAPCRQAGYAWSRP